MAKLEGTVGCLVEDILNLRDHVVAVRDQVAVLSVPPPPAVTYDMQGFPIVPHPVENDQLNCPVQPSVCNISSEINKDISTCGEG